jgi:hypothetical protein
MSPRVREVYEQYVKDLSAEEQQEMLELIRRDLTTEPPRKRRTWMSIAGTAPYPLCGEDAQEWVSRTRRESDEHRERHQR